MNDDSASDIYYIPRASHRFFTGERVSLVRLAGVLDIVPDATGDLVVTSATPAPEIEGDMLLQRVELQRCVRSMS
jgi:hypothetical protein